LNGHYYGSSLFAFLICHKLATFVKFPDLKNEEQAILRKRLGRAITWLNSFGSLREEERCFRKKINSPPDFTLGACLFGTNLFVV